MRCRSCDQILDEPDLVRRDEYGEFLDLCSYCFKISEQAVLDACVEDPATIKEEVSKYE